jgi:membrane protease YdiL (CAAX protease family)
VIWALTLAAVLAVLPLGVVAVVLAAVGVSVGEEVVERPAVAIAAIECSMLAVAGGFLLVRPDAVSELGLAVPDAADLALGAAFLPITYLTMGLQSVVARLFDLNAGGDDLGEYSTPAVVAIALVLVGPAEELLYRGVVQGLLVGPLGTVGGVAAMAVLFGLVHYPSYGASSVREIDAGVALGMAGTSVGGATFGTLYVLTDTLLVPMAVHSLYDAALFANLLPGIEVGDADDAERPTA